MSDVLTKYRVNEARRSGRSEAAELAYHYPQYTLEDIVEMPIGDRNLLLTYSRLAKAEFLLQLTSILAATQSPQGYKHKTNALEKVIKELQQQL